MTFSPWTSNGSSDFGAELGLADFAAVDDDFGFAFEAGFDSVDAFVGVGLAGVGFG